MWFFTNPVYFCYVECMIENEYKVMTKDVYFYIKKNKEIYYVFGRLSGYVTYGIKAIGFKPISFWEHLVPLNYGKLRSNHNNLCWNVLCENRVVL